MISVAAVEKHVTAIFRKLEVSSDTSGHRRVQAVLRFLSPQRT
jgi:DNA-binding NarL/FixJ family response regulator